MPSLIDTAGRPLKTATADARSSSPASNPASPLAGTPQAAAAPDEEGASVKEVSLETFAVDVLDASMDVPVIVDFWAPWCGPCKQLGPILERVVAQTRGAVRLVKVNIDENPEIAQQLRIQSIPTVYAFKNGQPVDGFMGAIPESQIRTFVETLGGGAAAAAAGGIAEALAVAAAALAKRDLATAAQLFGQILQEEPGQPQAVAGLARCYLESGDIERAKNTLGLVRPDSAGDESIRAVEAELSLKERASDAGDLGNLRARVAAAPDDLQARYDLAVALAAQDNREDAIEELLEIIRRDRKWNDDSARKQLVTLFDAMGPVDPRTITARRRLSSILFS